ncbi:MAG: hypothetical protein HZA22_00350 [Nitrospirae bacterium]|nr:hypothetical protein [Nitrospirota bacterium]
MLIFAALLATGLAALASDGTVNRSWQEDFYVFDGVGNGRTNCAGARFTTRTYRSGALANQSWTFRNFTSNGMYEATTTPSVTGRYVTFVFYSSAYVGTFTKWIRSYDVDTAYAGLDGHMTSQDAAVAAIPTDPLRTGDARLNNLDAAVSGRAPASTALSSATWTSARASKLDNLDKAVGAVDDDPWDNPGRFLSNYTGIDARLTASHGSGLWSAAGSVTVVPFQGAVSHETVSKGLDVHVVRGDSVAMPYSAGKDISGWSVWFGAKANPADEEYALPLRDITSYVTDASTGGGLISLAASDTDVQPRRYHAEVELRKAGEVNTPLRFYLWVDSDVIR